LDIFVFNGPNNIQKSINNIFDPCSDHASVLLTLKTNPVTLKNKNTNLETFKNIIDTNLTLNIKIKNYDDIENVTNSLTSLIQTAS